MNLKTCECAKVALMGLRGKYIPRLGQIRRDAAHSAQTDTAQSNQEVFRSLANRDSCCMTCLFFRWVGASWKREVIQSGNAVSGYQLDI